MLWVPVLAGFARAGGRRRSHSPRSSAFISGKTTPTAPAYPAVVRFYGSDDARVNATIPKSEEMMKAAGKTYEPVMYEGAGHGFMRQGEAPDAKEANVKAREQAWQRWKELLANL